MAVALRSRAGGGGAEPRHVGDRAAGRRLLAADRRPRPARGRTEDRAERLRGGLDDGAERTEDAARDRRAPRRLSPRGTWMEPRRPPPTSAGGRGGPRPF